MIVKRSESLGFSLVELALVICILAILASLLLPLLSRPRGTSSRLQCVNNLKQIGVAYRIWAGDNGDRVPQQVPIREGGWKDLLQYSAGQYCWTNYVIMQNELGQSPRVLVCPQDEQERTSAKNFINFQIFNTNISYFVGAGANLEFPRSFLGGDRNLSAGEVARNDYGFSKRDGSGNDVIVQTNSAIEPLTWSLNMHSAGSKVGKGNLLMGDGSVQQCSSESFRKDFQPQAIDSGNFYAGYVNQSNSFRLVFP